MKFSVLSLHFFLCVNAVRWHNIHMSKTPKLKDEFDFYLKNQESLLEEHEGKFVVIKGHKVIGSFDNIREAVDETSKEHEPGTFLVQKCTPGEEDYTATFHSRVHFA